MITRISRLAPSLALALALAAGPALAQTDDLAMAISETQKAIHYGAEVAHSSLSCSTPTTPSTTP